MKLMENYSITKEQLNNIHNENIHNFYNIKKNTSRNLTIGFLINNFYNNYEFEIWEGANQAIVEHKGNLINFIGASIDNPYFNNNEKNKIYELPNINNIDGLLISSSSIGSYIKYNEMKSFISLFDSIPCISIGTSMPNIPSIVINNNKGFYDLMVHLIEKHNYKNFAFIRGPKNNKDANERFETYKIVLNQYNIKINPNLIINGSFHANFGKEAVLKLLDERKAAFDVLIGSNDFVALNAVKELNRRGIKVPDEIAVVGFDNVIDCNYIENSLTTVNQPVFELGYTAGMKMLSILNNENVSLKQELNSQLIVRKSCGCKIKSNMLQYNNYYSINKEKLMSQKEKTTYFTSIITKIMKMEFDELIIESDISNWAKKLLISIIKDLENISSNTFILEFEKIIKNPKLNKININSWNPIMTFIFDKIIPRINNLNKNIKYNDLFQDAFKMINNFKIKDIENSMFLTNEMTMIMSSFKKKIQNINKEEKLKTIIYNFLPLFGIKSFYISILFKREQVKLNSDYYKIFYGYKNYKNLKQEFNTFNVDTLIPGGIKNYKTYDSFFIFPIIQKNTFFGFTIFEIEKNKINSSNLLRTQMIHLYEEITSELGIKITSFKNYQKNKVLSKSSLKYKYINFDKITLEKYYQEIKLYMKEKKPYLNLDLTLPMLAKELNITRNNLSYILNKIFNLSFYDFIYEYRIEEAMIYLRKNEDEKLNYLDIAYDSGFKSKSTFNKMFKYYTNMTPSEYRNNYLLQKNSKK